MLTVRWQRIDAKEKKQSYREQSRVAHELLSALLAENQIPLQALSCEKSGRPFLKDVVGDLSITHTQGLCACVLCLPNDGKACRVGLDAEALSGVRSAEWCKKAAKRFFAPCELSFVLASNDPQYAFLRVFVQKEAYAKYTGSGLAKALRSCDTMAPDFCRNNGIRYEIFEESGFLMALLTDCDEHALFEQAKV